MDIFYIYACRVLIDLSMYWHATNIWMTTLQLDWNNANNFGIFWTLVLGSCPRETNSFCWEIWTAMSPLLLDKLEHHPFYGKATCMKDDNTLTWWNFMNILKDHGLVALNTWDPTEGPTYVHGETATRIDYVCTRFCHADAQAKQVKVLTDVPFIPSPNFGHRPLIGHLPKIRLLNRRRQVLGFSLHQRRQLRQEWLTDSEKWQDLLHSSHQHLETFLQQADPDDTHFVTSLHDALIPCARNMLHGNRSCIATHTDYTAQYHHQITSKWHHMALVRKLVQRPLGLAQWFQCWTHIAKATQLHRTHKKYATQIRKQRFHDLVQEADRAAANHDTFKMHGLIRAVAPKAPKRRIQLRNDQGALAHPVEELAILKSFCQWNVDSTQSKFSPCVTNCRYAFWPEWTDWSP